MRPTHIPAPIHFHPDVTKPLPCGTEPGPGESLTTSPTWDAVTCLACWGYAALAFPEAAARVARAVEVRENDLSPAERLYDSGRRFP